MPTLSHQVEIKANANDVFEACRDVTRWSTFMPAVKQAEFVESSEAFDVVSIVAEANDQTWSWKSQRQIDKSRFKITFERLDPPKPILFLTGSWIVQPIGDDEVRLSLTHIFRTEPEGVEMEAFLTQSIRSNAQRDLQALKTVFEGRK